LIKFTQLSEFAKQPKNQSNNFLADYIGIGLIEFFGKIVRDLSPLMSHRGLMLLSTVEINIVKN